MKTTACLLYLKTFTHFKEPCVPTGKKDEDKIEVLCFMSKERYVWIQRGDILAE